jgi:hypothetical protein
LRLNRNRIAFAACVLAGCASIDAPVSQTIHVETPGCKAVSCVLSNDRGSWRLPNTPGDVTVISSRQPLRAVCVAEGGIESSGGTPATQAPPSHDGAVTGMAVGTAATLALGGAALAFIPPLGIIAVMTGASLGAAGGAVADANVQRFSYPPLISIQMSCDGSQDSAAAAAPKAARVGVAFRGMTAEEGRAAGVGDRGGVLVTSVAEGGAAAAAGLKGGDIVLAIAGQSIADAGEFEQVVLGLPAGSALELRVWRDRREVDLTLNLPKAAP